MVPASAIWCRRLQYGAGAGCHNHQLAAVFALLGVCRMLCPNDFSALRLSRVFPSAHLEGYPRYTAVSADPEQESHCIEYLGGSWAVERIDGVTFWYPASDGGSLAIVELWASHLVAFGRR